MSLTCPAKDEREEKAPRRNVHHTGFPSYLDDWSSGGIKQEGAARAAVLAQAASRRGRWERREEGGSLRWARMLRSPCLRTRRALISCCCYGRRMTIGTIAQVRNLTLRSHRSV